MLQLIQRLTLRIAIALVASLLVILIFLLYLRQQPLPPLQISQTSQMLDADGQVIDTFHAGENRRSVPLAEISPYVIAATLATEDRHFYDHHGFQFSSMLRAALVNLRSGYNKQGASTLTQQLARNLYLTHERTWTRKLKEAKYTAQLEMKYSKDDLLAMYLNQIYYGHGAYGIEAASMLYFGKHASELTLGESALLAGIPKGPRYYSPHLSLDNAQSRQALILHAMEDTGAITSEEALQAQAEPLALLPMPDITKQTGFAPYFRDYVRQFVVQQLNISSDLLYEGGLTIHTTLDQAVQRSAEDAIAQQLPTDSEQQAALTAIDPRNGHIKAMVGGRDYLGNQYNRALATTRQPGSAFKPFVYLTALHRRELTPASQFHSAPTLFTYDEGRKKYEPHNYRDRYAGKPIDMRQAIASSDNIYAVNTLAAIGAEPVIEMSRSLGVTSMLQPVPSLALGTSPISPLEMAAAYGVFANQGEYITPLAVTRIVARDGSIIYEAIPQSTQAISSAEAYVLTNLLRSVFQPGGTAYRVAATIDRPVAGKTGTTATDAWTVGYTPTLSAAVWVGYDKDRKLSPVEALRAAPIFAKFVSLALKNDPVTDFSVPATGVEFALVDPTSGKLASNGCSKSRLEVFLTGTAPTERCEPLMQDLEKQPNNNQEGDSTQSDSEHQPRKKQGWWQRMKRLIQ